MLRVVLGRWRVPVALAARLMLAAGGKGTVCRDEAKAHTVHIKYAIVIPHEVCLKNTPRTLSGTCTCPWQHDRGTTAEARLRPRHRENGTQESAAKRDA
jgi:hypothetical protein